MNKFEDAFFEDEWREGFFVESKMKRAWAAQMVVLEEIDRICKSHGIQYFADSGTLLGAVRHKGFIPWDDDIDIAMKRNDYNKFMQVVREELPAGWALCNAAVSHGGEWGQAFARVINGKKICFNEEHLTKYYGCPYVVGVDIFPLDNLPDDKEEQIILYSLMKIAYGIIFDLQKNELETANKRLMELEQYCNIKLDRNGNLQRQLFQLMDTLSSSYLNDETAELVLYSWWAYKDKKYSYKQEWYKESIEVPFENMMIPIPIGFDGALKAMYGEDYMVPVRGTADHDYPFYKKYDVMIEEKRKQNETI